jgi:hypothetical protein
LKPEMIKTQYEGEFDWGNEEGIEERGIKDL